MERAIKEETGLKRWRKLGGGSFYLKGRIIKPNQVFQAELADIPKGFRDVVVLVDSKAGKAVGEVLQDFLDIPDVPVAEVVFTLKKKGGAYYNVEDADGKVMNEKGLRKEDAEALIKSLS